MTLWTGLAAWGAASVAVALLIAGATKVRNRQVPTPDDSTPPASHSEGPR